MSCLDPVVLMWFSLVFFAAAVTQLIGRRKKTAGALLIPAAILWTWLWSSERGPWYLFSLLGILVGAAGVLIYIEGVKSDILAAIGELFDKRKESDDAIHPKR